MRLMNTDAIIMGDQDSHRKTYTISLLGDVMLGRLIDQLLPFHVDEPEDADTISRIRARNHHLSNYNYKSPWGNALGLLKASDLVLCNLETSVTTHAVKWPDKVFNYRMHPKNIECLVEAGVNYVSLANNHTLDFSKEGLFETVRTLKAADIAFAGAGQAKAETDRRAVLKLPVNTEHSTGSSDSATIHIYSFSDHPSDWRAVDEFNHLEYTSRDRARLEELLTKPFKGQHVNPCLKVVSVHWGPNYQWQPDREIKEMARFLIDTCAVDVVWGHSSHHIQGIEVYQGKFIIYGCGDFVDDYAVNQGYRNDLSAVWNLKIAQNHNNEGGQLKVERLEIWPNRIKNFQAGLLDEQDKDHAWVRTKFTVLCAELGTKVEPELGSGGQMAVNIDNQ